MRTRSLAIPATFADFTTEWCAWSLVYITPARMSVPSSFSRAQTIALKFAIEPPVVNNPRVVDGNPIQSRSQSRTFDSSCTSAGAACQMPVKRFVVSVMKSASAAGYTPPPGMNAK